MTNTGDLFYSALSPLGLVSPLPTYVDVRKAFDLETAIEGQISLDRLPRFVESLASHSGEVNGKLQFSITETGRRVILGSVSAKVVVACQRCLEPLALQLSDTIQLALIENESQIGSLEARWDPWLIDGPRIAVAGLVEEQLILSMPLVSYHPDNGCADALGYKQMQEDLGGDDKNRMARNPFDVLKVLKQDDEAL